MGFKTSMRPHAFTLVSAIFLLQACSSTPSKTKGSETGPGSSTSSGPEVDPVLSQISKLQDRIQDLETRLSALNDKINLENGVVASTPSASAKPPTAIVEPPPAHGKVIPHAAGIAKAAKDEHPLAPVAEHFSSEAIDRFREAKILFDSKRYSDAVLEFSEFVKNHPDHPLAPQAQYLVGMSYLNQKEYKLAEEELNRGLLAYSHSNAIPDTLLALAQVSESLNKPARSTYFKEKLISHFPNSPQAKGISLKVSKNHEMKTNLEPQVLNAGPKTIEGPEEPKVTTPSVEGANE